MSDTPILPKLLEYFPPRCLACDYILSGLAAGANCPECGEPSISDVLVVPVWNIGLRPRAFLLLYLWPLWFVGFNRMISNVLPRRLGEFWVVMMAIPCIEWIWNSFIQHRSPQDRLRVGSNGIQLVRETGKLKLREWSNEMELIFQPTRGSRHTFQIKWHYQRWIAPRRESGCSCNMSLPQDVLDMLKQQMEKWRLDAIRGK